MYSLILDDLLPRDALIQSHLALQLFLELPPIPPLDLILLLEIHSNLPSTLPRNDAKKLRSSNFFTFIGITFR